MSPTHHIYISGPMRGRDGFNFPAFYEAEGVLRDAYPLAVIFSPANADVEAFHLEAFLEADPTGLSAGRHLAENDFDEADLRNALGRDLAYITAYCDLMVMLPGWEGSKGATAERATALALGAQVVEYDEDAAPNLDWLKEEVAASWGALPPELVTGGETRVVSATGGQKGVKLAAFDQISPEVEVLIAEHFGKGARKYDAHNFRNGYPWSQSYSALRRHLAAFWGGEEFDTCPKDGHGCLRKPGDDYEPGTCYNHTGSLHIVACIWHTMVLTEFYLHRGEYDDRYVYQTT